MRNRNKIILSFFFALFAAIFGTAIFPNVHLFYFAPFLVMFFINTTFINSLWASSFCGFIMDALSSTPMGLYTLGYALLCMLLFKLRRFFNDQDMNIPIFTLILACVFAFIEILLLAVFKKKNMITSMWFLSDLILMPICDSIYSIVWFVLPSKIFNLVKRNILLAFSRRRKT